MSQFQTVGLKTALLGVVSSIYVMKMLAKKTAVFVPIVVPWVCRYSSAFQ